MDIDGHCFIEETIIHNPYFYHGPKRPQYPNWTDVHVSFFGFGDTTDVDLAGLCCYSCCLGGKTCIVAKAAFIGESVNPIIFSALRSLSQLTRSLAHLLAETSPPLHF
jgi:hypothetical protein